MVLRWARSGHLDPLIKVHVYNTIKDILFWLYILLHYQKGNLIQKEKIAQKFIWHSHADFSTWVIFPLSKEWKSALSDGQLFLIFDLTFQWINYEWCTLLTSVWILIWTSSRDFPSPEEILLIENQLTLTKRKQCICVCIWNYIIGNLLIPINKNNNTLWN